MISASKPLVGRSLVMTLMQRCRLPWHRPMVLISASHFVLPDLPSLFISLYLV